MKTTAPLAGVASAVIAGAFPTSEDPLAAHSFDKSGEIAVLGGKKVSKTDLYAGVAATNQQLYQATKKSNGKMQSNKYCCQVRVGNLLNRREAQLDDEVATESSQPDYPGCRNRCYDFIATHIKQTLMSQATGNFLLRHKWYMYAYEQPLRNECGYKSHYPYYDWPRWADNPMESPLLDGSATSVGGNNELGCANQTFYGVPSNEDALVVLPKGNGGSCVKSDPFNG